MSAPLRRRAAATDRPAVRLLLAAALALILGAAFAAYLDPDMVLDFAALLQTCGLR